jgi:hypothetical protein
MRPQAKQQIDFILRLTNSQGLHDVFQELIIEDAPIYSSNDDNVDDENQIQYDTFENYLVGFIEMLHGSKGEGKKYTLKSLSLKGLLRDEYAPNGGMKQDLFNSAITLLGNPSQF